MKSKTFQCIYKNKAKIKVKVCHPPKNWIEPRDCINLTFDNKEFGVNETMIMRPDEALVLISLLSNAVEYYYEHQSRDNSK